MKADNENKKPSAAAPVPKRRLRELAEDFGLPPEKLEALAFKHLDEGMLTGKGKGLWVDGAGQAVLEELIPVPKRYRGRVLQAARNPRFVYVYCQELHLKLQVRIPHGLGLRMVGKNIYFDAVPQEDGETVEYVYNKPPIGG